MLIIVNSYKCNKITLSPATLKNEVNQANTITKHYFL